jgi:multiple sugar transport system substrate-binding protein
MIKVHRPAAPRRRKLVLPAALVASALALAACSSSSHKSATPSSSAPAPTSSAPTASTAPSSSAPSSSAPSSSAPSSASPASYGFNAAKQDPTSAITVWVDATRQPAVDAFKKAHPEIKVNAVTYDGGANGTGSFQTKITADDQAGSGWPDVVWSTQNNDATWASQGKTPFAAPLNKGYFEQSFLDGFTPGALAPTTINGTVYGLRNDLAATVTWYDTSLMTKFGYTPPKTWEDYLALGQKVAKDHPGYIVGDVGDPWAPEVYFWGAKAPMNTVTGATGFSANAADPKTVQMATLLDTLIKDGAISQDSVFGASFIKKYTGKVLMLPGPVWYSGALFQNNKSLNSKAGTIDPGLPLSWSGDTPAAGNVGGGTWFISQHSKNLAADKTFLEFVTSADDYQVDLAPGLPAYKSAGDKWLAKQATSNFFTPDFTSNISTAAGEVWTGWGYPNFSQEAVWAKAVTPGLAAGKSLVSLLPSWQKALDNQATVNGYTVN